MLFLSADRLDSEYPSILLNLAQVVVVVLVASLSACSQERSAPTALTVCGATITIRFEGRTAVATQGDLTNWVKRAAEAVCTYYGKFPVPHVALDVRVRGGAGVHGGTTYPDGGGYITISVGEDTTVAQLNNDWELTHEMIHLAFPSMRRSHHWIEEGISVYVEPIARVQAGQLTAERMWSDVVRDMWQGEPASGDRGLDNTHTWARTYWGGALYCLMADVRIRKQTHGQKGLDDALRGILSAGGNITQDWEIERALAMGDKATGTTVLTDLYHEMSDQPDAVDLKVLWMQLGIERRDDGSVKFDNNAPLASVREAITRKQP